MWHSKLNKQFPQGDHHCLRRDRRIFQGKLFDNRMIERGEINGSIDTMERIAHALNLEVRDLLNPALMPEHLSNTLIICTEQR